MDGQNDLAKEVGPGKSAPTGERAPTQYVVYRQPQSITKRKQDKMRQALLQSAVRWQQGVAEELLATCHCCSMLIVDVRIIVYFYETVGCDSSIGSCCVYLHPGRQAISTDTASTQVIL